METVMLTAHAVTPDEMLKIKDHRLYELVDGELREKHMGAKSSWIATRVSQVLGGFVKDPQLGWVINEATYTCFKDQPGMVRRPDVSFIRAGRLKDEQLPDGHILIAPDLAVEVISPNDKAFELERKIMEYQSAGVALIWIVISETRRVRVYMSGGPIIELREGQELDGGAVLPGFRCAVAELFPPKAAK